MQQVSDLYSGGGQGAWRATQEPQNSSVTTFEVPTEILNWHLLNTRIACADLLLCEEYHTVIHALYDRHVKGKGLRQKVRQLKY